jgi:biotin transporter BioY
MIAGYAYEDTEKFSNKGFSSLFHIAFHIIMYCVFIGIIYASFIYIGDMYYPGPLDGFTYLFPDFIFGDMVDGQAASIGVNEGFRRCFDAAAGNVDSIRACLARLHVDFEMPSLERPMGSLMPLLGVGVMSLMIMGSMKEYAGIVGGYMMTISENIVNLGKSALKTVVSVARNKVGSMREKAPYDRMMDKRGDKLAAEADQLLRNAKKAGGQ